jgi:lipopolysaccharide export system permease protein
MYHIPAMTTTFYRYIFREIAVPFFLGLATFTGALMMGRIIQIADLVVARGVSLVTILRLVSYLLPYFFMITIPMSLLLAVLLAFGRLSADSEITAMKSCGVSLFRLLPPVLACAFIAYIATTIVTLYGLPWGNSSFRNLLIDIVQSRATLNLKERVFNDDFPGLVIYVEHLGQKDNLMSGILIQDERNPREPSTIFANTGMIINDPESKNLRLSLKNGSIQRSLGKTDYRLLEFQDYDLSINLAQAARETIKTELDMTTDELHQKLRDHPTDDKFRRDMLIEYHRRLALPVACFVFALIAVPLGVQTHRSGKASGFSISIGIMLLYYIVFNIGKTLGQKGTVSAAVAVWSPDLIFLLFGGYLFWKTAVEQSIPLVEFVRQLPAMIRNRTNRTEQNP